MNNFQSFIFCFIAALHVLAAAEGDDPCILQGKVQCGCRCINPFNEQCAECEPGSNYCQSAKKCIGYYEPCDKTCFGDNLYYYELDGQEFCLDRNDVWECEGKTVPKMSSCNGECHSGYSFVEANSICMEDSGLGKTFWECNTAYFYSKYNCDDDCKSTVVACGDRCPSSDFRLCRDRCYTPDELCQISGFKKCGDGYIFVNDVECRKPEEVHKCGEDIFLELYQPCNGTCPNNWRLGFCDSSTEVGHLLPDNGKCVLNTDQFDGKCPEGFELCGKSKCRKPGDALWTCGDACNSFSQPCNGTCPQGTTLSDQKCRGNGAENLFNKTQFIIVTIVAIITSSLLK